jgi:hypothetical protein
MPAQFAYARTQNSVVCGRLWGAFIPACISIILTAEKHHVYGALKYWLYG